MGAEAIGREGRHLPAKGRYLTVGSVGTSCLPVVVLVLLVI